MIKKILPLALCGLLAGCAAIKEFEPLKAGFQTFFVRSLVVAKPDGSGTEKHAFLIWGSTGDKLSAMKRGPKGGDPTTDVAGIDLNSAFYDDKTVSEGGEYAYKAVFGSNSVLREIKVLEVSGAGTVTRQTPNILADPQEAMSVPTRPAFTWTVDDSNGKPSGFLVSVVEASDVNNTTGLTPVYTAFLDAASHSTGVAYGTRSDMAAITKELLDVLKNVDTKYAQKDTDVAPLKPGTKYVWLMAPIAVDKEKASFAIGAQSPALFTTAQ